MYAWLTPLATEMVTVRNAGKGRSQNVCANTEKQTQQASEQNKGAGWGEKSTTYCP